jgi:hypothetical protein
MIAGGDSWLELNERAVDDVQGEDGDRRSGDSRLSTKP